MEYPAQIDCTWLASDASGRLAAVITAGQGPIPAFALESGFDIFSIEERLLDMPIIGDAVVVSGVPHPSSFISLSRRGLFVYDWTDVYKSHSRAQGAYELVACPCVAIRAVDLPRDLRDLSLLVMISSKIGDAHLQFGSEE